MQLGQRDKELAAIGAAIGCNCRPCIEHHIPVGRAGRTLQRRARRRGRHRPSRPRRATRRFDELAVVAGGS
jgi:AhpD family alkylhydroperoxidase